MYEPVQKQSAVGLLKDWINTITVQQGADGLELAMPVSTQQGIIKGLRFPDRLEEYLVGLRLLRNVPLCYLAPDAALLPPESIRFFNVDYTWVDRVIDGVFASANTGTVDATFSYVMLKMVRQALDARLKTMAADAGDASGWAPGSSKPMTGMLMRSAIVRRWPKLIVEAYHDAAGAQTAAALRAEAITRDVYIALFAGAPQKVLVKEPFVGLRFGVEKTGTAQNPKYEVDKRDADGKNVGDLDVPVSVSASRKLDINALAASIGSTESRMIALSLEQRPFQQVFLRSIEEKKGSVSPLGIGSITLSRGKVMKLDKYIKRFDQHLATEKP
jgi:hypothetical protein